MILLKSWKTLVEEALLYLKEADPILGSAIERVGACTLEPDPHIFEALVDAIISQQISVKAADSIMARLRSLLPAGQVEAHALLQLDPAALRTVGLSSQKIRYIRDLTEHVVSGRLDLARLPDLDDEAVVQALTQVRGIGRWTAEMILIFSLGRPDVLPVDDLGFAEGVRQLYELEQRPTRQELLACGECWRPYRTFATWYVWRMRRLLMQDERARTRIVSL
jgi:DNA-3-methyladenine glycosylase II